MLGQTLADKYVLERLLGEGGMGAVYEARNNATGRRVAVKIITADGTQKATVVRRFAIEARAAGAVESLYIAQVLDAGEDTQRGIPFIVMEYLSGEDLDQLLARLGPLPQALVVKLGAQVCLGLAKAHAAGVVHRDVKPANIFLAERDGDERGVKLLDFGVAKVKMEIAQDDAKLTSSGSLVGSPTYMSPEQARGKSEIDRATDIWSLGIVLYQALSGHTPHEDSAGIGDLIISICGDPPSSVQLHAPWVGSKLAAIVARALMMDPRERFASADEMYAALRSLSPENIAVSNAELVPVSGNERIRLGEPATGPWVPTGEEFPREEVTATRPALARPSNPVAVGLATTAAVQVEAEPTMPLPTPMLDSTGSELPTVVRPNELLGPLKTVPIPKDINLAPLPPSNPPAPEPQVALAPPSTSRAPVVARTPSRVPIAMAIGVAGALGLAVWLSTRSEVDAAAQPTASPGASENPQATAAKPALGPSALEVTLVRSATSNAPPIGSIAALFGGEAPLTGEPVSIYSGGRASGVIMLLPVDFKNRLALGGEGLTASISNSNGVAACAISVRASTKTAGADPIDLTPGALTQACGKTLVSNPAWDAGTLVSWLPGPLRGRVWRAAGTYGGGQGERFAYVLATSLADQDIVACGAWNGDRPELEAVVVTALKSVRVGKAPPTDMNGL